LHLRGEKKSGDRRGVKKKTVVTHEKKSLRGRVGEKGAKKIKKKCSKTLAKKPQKSRKEGVPEEARRKRGKKGKPQGGDPPGQPYPESKGGEGKDLENEKEYSFKGEFDKKASSES